MQRLINFLIKHKKYTIGIFFVMFVIIVVFPLIINYLFKLVSPFDLFIAEWDAGDALAFYGAVLTFLSTSILSTLVLWQNHVIKEENNKHSAILERMEKAKNQPFFVIDEVSMQENAKDLSFYVKNISDNIAQNITFFNFCIKDNAGNVLNKIDKITNKDYLMCSTKHRINLTDLPIAERTERICFDIRYYDVIGEKHILYAVGYFLDNVSVPQFSIFITKDK